MTEENKVIQTGDADTASAEGVSNAADAESEVDGAEFSDGNDDGGRSENVAKKESSADVNRENAYRRREQERRAREIEAARVTAIIDAVGENPFTHEEMKDAEDVEEYLAMKEIQKQGGDPLSDYSKLQKKKIREERAAAAEAERQDEWYRKDREDFINKYPDVDLSKLVKDEAFSEYADGKVGRRPLSEIYEGYERIVKSAAKKAELKAAQALANSQATPGALSGGVSQGNEHFTFEQVKAMSDAEVRKNYDKIREDMKTWK